MSLTDLQLALRKTGIGASEAAAAIGMSAFGKGPMNVWAEKVLPLQREPPGPKQEMGNRIERFILLDLYQDLTGRKVQLTGEETLAHPLEPWILATPDARTPGRVVDAKNTGERMADRWGEPGEYASWREDLCPFDYWLQVQWQMLVTGERTADLAVLIGGWDFRVLTFGYDAEAVLGAVEEARAFWFEYVVPQRQPPADGEGALGILRRMFPNATKPLAQAEPGELAALDRLAQAKHFKKVAEVEEERACAEVAQLLGEREGLVWPGGRVTWKAPARGKPRYKDLALHLGATEEQIAEFTPPGTREMRFTPAKESK